MAYFEPSDTFLPTKLKFEKIIHSKTAGFVVREEKAEYITTSMKKIKK